MTDGIAAQQLRSFIERIERLHEERKALADDISEVFSQAKAHGFDVKVMREVLKIRRKDADELAEAEALLDVYLRALGMKPDFGTGTPVATRARAEVGA